MTITYSDFLQTVNENAGEILLTSGGLATFRLEKSINGITFTPLSTGKPRELNQESVERYLDIFNRTQSTRTSDYVDKKMQNRSYVLAIIKLWLGQRIDAPLLDDGTSAAGEIDPEFSAPEGNPKVRSHRHRERSRELVKMAKALFRKNHENRLFCEVCHFDFGTVYGDPSFIEAHHRVPLRDLTPGAKTKLSDLVMVCANCHRMLHRGTPWPAIEELRKKIEALRAN